MILQDTITYRPDGTPSSITRLSRETFTTPAGKELSDDATSEIDLATLASTLNIASSEVDKRNKELEGLLAAERADKEKALAEAVGAVQEVNKALTTERDGLKADLAAAQARLDAVAKALA